MLEIWLAALVDELDARDSASGLPTWLRRLRDDWHLQATTAFDGVMTCSLDPHVTDALRRDQLAELCRELQRDLERSVDPLQDALLQRVAGDRLLRPDLARALERVSGAFLWLLAPPPANAPQGGKDSSCSLWHR